MLSTSSRHLDLFEVGTFEGACIWTLCISFYSFNHFIHACVQRMEKYLVLSLRETAVSEMVTLPSESSSKVISSHKKRERAKLGVVQGAVPETSKYNLAPCYSK